MNRWTEEENTVLIECIKKNPHNIKEACVQASTQINRAASACQQHWYKVLSPASNPTKAGITFMAIGSKTIYKNRKNSGEAIAKPEKSTLWARIKEFIGLK